MCKKGCKCNKCDNNSGNSAGMAAQLAEMQDTLNQLSDALKPFQCGHPILLIEHADDINSFDFSTGLGKDCWENWAICDGQSHYSDNNKKNIATPNFIDRFIVMGGGVYPIDSTGGSTSVTLTVPQLPSHTHVIDDPGHNHTITDPGHTHELVDPGHTHTFAGGGHTHTFTTDSAGSHNHSTGITTVAENTGTGVTVRDTTAVYGDATTDDGVHVHTGTTNSASISGTLGAAFTGISDNLAFTGITNEPNTTGITNENTGSGDAIDITPMFYSAIYIMKFN